MADIHSSIYAAPIKTNSRAEAIRLINKTFKDYSIEYLNDGFLLDRIWILICIYDEYQSIRVRFSNVIPSSIKPDVVLEIFQDIESIPLMHNAIVASKSFKE